MNSPSPLRTAAPVWAGALAGLLAAASGVAVGTAVATSLRGVPSPIESVGNRAIDHAPPFLKELAVKQFGTADKPILIAADRITTANRALTPVPLVVTLAVSLAALVLLLSTLAVPGQHHPMGLPRRSFFKAALGVSALVVLGGVAGRALGSTAAAVSRAGIRLPGSAMPAPVPVGAQVGIQRVDVRVDDGSWQEATLAAEDTIETWRQWSWQWDDATEGTHRLTVRATNKNGETQTSDRARIRPNGTTGWHSVQFRVE